LNYRIVYLFKEEPKKYLEKLIKNVFKKFNVNFVYSGKNPSHLTLKYRFETDKIREVEKIVKKICDSHKFSYFNIGGIGSFNKNTLHIKVKPSKEMVSFEKDLLKNLSKFRGNFPKLDKDLDKNFHVGIAHRDIEEKFDEIKKYLKKQDRKFKVKFDKIYLIKKPKNKWVIQKRFNLRCQ